MHFDLRHLRAIRAIDKCGGLSRAADMLNLTQSPCRIKSKGLRIRRALIFLCGAPNR